MEQLIKLTVYQKRDQVLPTALEQIFDVDDIISPVRFASGKAYFTAKSKTPKSVISPIVTDFKVNETLDQIDAKSAKFMKLNVVSRQGTALLTAEDMLFNTTKVCESMYASTGGTSFLYNEEGAPNPTLYEVSDTLDEIITASSLSSETIEQIIAAADSISGVVSWKKVTLDFNDFATDDVTNQVEVYTAAAKEMIHAVHVVHTESFDSFDDGDPDADPEPIPPAAIYTQYDLTVGITGNTDKYVEAVDLLPAPDGVLSAAVITAPEVDMNDPVVILAEITADDDLDLANQGIVEFYILTSKLP